VCPKISQKTQTEIYVPKFSKNNSRAITKNFKTKFKKNQKFQNKSKFSTKNQKFQKQKSKQTKNINKKSKISKKISKLNTTCYLLKVTITRRQKGARAATERRRRATDII